VKCNFVCPFEDCQRKGTGSEATLQSVLELFHALKGRPECNYVTTFGWMDILGHSSRSYIDALCRFDTLIGWKNCQDIGYVVCIQNFDQELSVNIHFQDTQGVVPEGG
jgi:hypothetical protein